jgi:hypothetical protein
MNNTLHIRNQLGLPQEYLSLLLGISQQQLMMNDLDEIPLQDRPLQKLKQIQHAFLNPEPVDTTALQAVLTESLNDYQQSLNQTIHDCKNKRWNLEQKLQGTQQAYDKALRLWQMCNQLLNDPLYSPTESDRQLVGLIQSFAIDKLCTNSPHVQQALQIQIDLLYYHEQLAQEQLSLLTWAAA